MVNNAWYIARMVVLPVHNVSIQLLFGHNATYSIPVFVPVRVLDGPFLVSSDPSRLQHRS